ncbi:MAG: uracil-DNA glycosylase [Anaerolineaceae bacterium]|nr:uracil-DNA glycosylase [Anaerolineaceae bacterium]
MEPAQVLQDVAQQAAVCTLCDLHLARKNAVPGEGPANAEIVFIGEGPGFYENEQGRPFVGAAGKFLDELLERAGLDRQAVFITNVVKCRPPGNRDPEPGELEVCTRTYLQRQLEAIQPLVIVTLGRFSMGLYLPDARISAIHGQARWVNGRLVVPMFHPAAALHQPKWKSSVEEDFARLPATIEQARKLRANAGAAPGSPSVFPESAPKEDAPGDDAPTQLSLF